MRSTYLLLFLGIIVPQSSCGTSQQPLNEGANRQYYICDGCVPRELVLAPGVGFDLSSPYGTAAIRYYNGTVVDIGRVEGSPEYKDFMARLSAPYKQYGPPFRTPLDRVEYDLDQAKRRLRRLQKLPSTEDISTLHVMLSKMRYLVMQELHMLPRKIVLSLPYMPNFQPEDLAEAMELADLTPLESFRHFGDSLDNTKAALAGMGTGICEHWQDIQKCDEEQDRFKIKQTLALTYTYDELVVETFLMINPYHFIRVERSRFPDLSYGTWDTDRTNTTYWDTIGRKVVETAKKRNTLPWPVEELVLMGEYAEEKRFLDSIWKALGGSMDVQKLWAPLQRPKFSAEFIAARGAAEMAKRWLGETWGCVEGDWCEGNRD
ncbi:uncharacterized protein LY89DRAFT_778968 [Mollisia scopiformis]|uniref:Uncharacterized protein n=1 Tax=Mollisia scopiformis TaxID=149040 RepID=A0A194XMQ6_MOLSC|nr:uncharacterized protein LY89DRAFT_778968 [Mollisia scopiformis]KUJ21438.1 hypothetical protein LY89DRAFT_778968 [Mollisia scopiformis]